VELSKMYPPDRFGPKTANNPWLTGYNTIVDNIRQQYGPQLAAYAKADAEGIEGAGAKLAELQAQIQQQAQAMAEKILGPMPNQAPAEAPGAATDPTPELIANIDNAVQQFGGDFMALKKDILADQKALREAGVDVQAYIKAVRDRIERRPTVVGAPTKPEKPIFFK
jgi:hypothetical protein